MCSNNLIVEATLNLIQRRIIVLGGIVYAMFLITDVLVNQRIVFVHTSMCRCLYIPVCAGVCTYLYVQVFVHTSMCRCLYIPVCAGVCTYLFVQLFVRTCMCSCLYVHVCAAVCTYLYVQVFVRTCMYSCLYVPVCAGVLINRGRSV